MKSMTGFAKQQTEYNGHKYTIEIKTLNSKTLDLNTKIPASLHNRELEIRTMLNALERGKIDFIITDENTSTNIQLNHELVQSRYQEITALADQLHCTQHNILDTIPQSDAAFAIAKDALTKRLASERKTKFGIINAWLAARNRGIDYDINERIYNALPNITLQDVVRFEQQNIANKPYRYVILGDEKELDIKALEKIAPIKRLTTEEIFGY